MTNETRDLFFPVETVSELNRRDHWSVRSRRVKNQRQAVRLLWPWRTMALNFPLVVTLTRVSPRELDDDNLRGALKAIRDQVADNLGLPSDRDRRVRWEYGQAKCKPREAGVRVVLVEALAVVGVTT